MKSNDPFEQSLLKPVLRLFPQKRYQRFAEVPFGRKKIDIWCISKEDKDSFVSIELKVKNWRKALWQATINFQIAKESYIAIWHKYLSRIEKHTELLDQYGVGLISVGPKSAKIVKNSMSKVIKLPRSHKKDFYANLIRV